MCLGGFGEAGTERQEDSLEFPAVCLGIEWGDKDLLSRMTVLGEENMGFGENTGLSIRRLKCTSQVCASLSHIDTEKHKLFLR